VRVLFDHNVPHKLRPSLTGREIKTADEMSWAELENGELLKAAEDAGFAVMVTCDKTLSYQQNLAARKMALVVLQTNRWSVLNENAPAILAALNRAQLVTFELVTFEDLQQRRSQI